MTCLARPFFMMIETFWRCPLLQGTVNLDDGSLADERARRTVPGGPRKVENVLVPRVRKEALDGENPHVRLQTSLDAGVTETSTIV